MKEVFLLSRKQHLSHREIAELMGISEQTAKKQMVYALKILKKKLGIVLFLMIYLFYPNLPPKGLAIGEERCGRC